MDKKIESTMEKRYDFLITKTNEIWKLEKKKGDLRDKLQEIRMEIKLGKNQTRRRTPLMEYGTAAGGIKKNEEIAENIKKEIDRIKKEQLEALEEIENLINI
jgi:hypothetical protein